MKPETDDVSIEFAHDDEIPRQVAEPAPSHMDMTSTPTVVDISLPSADASPVEEAPPAQAPGEAGSEVPPTLRLDAPPLPATGPVVAGPARVASLNSFARRGLFKLGVVGGKGTGKSYLFQAMVYRCQAASRAGALSRFIHGGNLRLFEADSRDEGMQRVNLRDFVRNYQRWNRLPFTNLDTQHWYRLEFPYRVGWLGTSAAMFDVEFFDGSGEGFFAGALDTQNRRVWHDGFLHAQVMVFCLPFWAAFPGRLREGDREARELFLKQFEDVVHNFNHLREVMQARHPVRSILALTMADDPRHGWPEMQERWLEPYREAPRTVERMLRREAGLAAYLSNARTVSRLTHNALLESPDSFVASIPGKLHFGAGEPWVVPLSAIDGQTLERIESSQAEAPDDDPPVPVHVELPLLVALCERTNALM